MANTDTPFGFILEPKAGELYDITPINITSSLADPIAIGDPITAGSGAVYSRSNATPTLVLGIVATIQNDDGDNVNYLPAGSTGKVGVLPVGSGIYFKIQMDSTVFAAPANLINQTFSFTVGDANQSLGKSVYVLDGSTVAGMGVNEFFVQRISTEKNNDFGEGFIKVIGCFRSAVTAFA